MHNWFNDHKGLTLMLPAIKPAVYINLPLALQSSARQKNEAFVFSNTLVDYHSSSAGLWPQRENMYARASAMATIYTWGVPWCQNQEFSFHLQCETLQSCEKPTQLNCQVIHFSLPAPALTNCPHLAPQRQTKICLIQRKVMSGDTAQLVKHSPSLTTFISSNTFSQADKSNTVKNPSTCTILL